MSANDLTVMAYNVEQNRRGGLNHVPSLAAAHAVDIALVQETPRPDRLPDGWTCYPSPVFTEDWRISVPPWYRSVDGAPKPTQRRFLSAIMATGTRPITPLQPTPLHEVFDGEFGCCHPGQFAVAVMPLGFGGRLILVSLYGLWERMLDSRSLYSEATLHRAISDLAFVFQAVDARYVLVGGDLNINSYSDGSEWGDRAMTVLARLRTYGLEICGPFRQSGLSRLERCPCPASDCRHEVTYYHQANPANRQYQLDWFVCSPALRERLVACWADPDTEWYRHSDHRAIFARFRV